VDAEKELLSLFDRAVLREQLTKLGKPLGPDGSGVTLAALDFFKDLRDALKTLLRDYPIATVADLPDDGAFAREAEKRGIDTNSFKELLGALRAKAVRVMELLRSLPPTWSLTVDRL
jgi:hypothetical protein